MKNKNVGMLISIIMLLSYFHLCPGNAMATDVGGIINTDTTWTIDGSPYNIVETIQIAAGVTLTINPGVTVN